MQSWEKSTENENLFDKMKKISAVSVKTTKKSVIKSRSSMNPCGCGRHLYILRLTLKLLQTTSLAHTLVVHLHCSPSMPNGAAAVFSGRPDPRSLLIEPYDILLGSGRAIKSRLRYSLPMNNTGMQFSYAGFSAVRNEPIHHPSKL